MIQLTVKKVGKVGDTGTTVTPYSSMFQELKMDEIRADGQDTLFSYGDKEYTVDETYAQVSALLTILTTTKSNVKELWGVIDFANAGSGTIATHDVLDPITLVAIKVPKGAIIVNGFAFIKTTFTSATDAATIALGIETDSAAGLKAAIAISNGANPWDAGKTALIPVGTAATALSGILAERKVQYTVAVEALTAGKMLVLLQYVTDPIA
jgi:hypothetical protein